MLRSQMSVPERRAEEGAHASHGDLTPEQRRIATHWRLNPSMDGSKRSLWKAEQGPHVVGMRPRTQIEETMLIDWPFAKRLWK
jgi:hypothetical protein